MGTHQHTQHANLCQDYCGKGEQRHETPLQKDRADGTVHLPNHIKRTVMRRIIKTDKDGNIPTFYLIRELNLTAMG